MGIKIDKYVNIAHLAVAIVAVGGFIFSLISSAEVSKRLGEFSEAVASYTAPLIAINNFNFIGTIDSTETVNHLGGICFDVVNISSFPIFLETSEFTVFYGEHELKGDDTHSGVIDGSIISLGGHLTSGKTNDLIKHYLKDRQFSMSPPYLKIYYHGRIRSITGKISYDYTVTHNLDYDDEQKKFRSFTSGIKYGAVK